MDGFLLGKRFAELHIAVAPAVAIAAAGSMVGQVAAVVQTSPLWVYALPVVAPVVSVLGRELVAAARYSRWLALFCLLLLSQSAYVVVKGLGIDAPVRPVWTSLAVAGLVFLAYRFPRNLALWVTLLLSIWDAVDPHLIIGVAEVAALNLSFASELGRKGGPLILSLSKDEG